MRLKKLTSFCCVLLALLATVSLVACGQGTPGPQDGQQSGGNNSLIDDWDNGTDENDGNEGAGDGTILELASFTVENLKEAKIVYPANVYAVDGKVESALHTIINAINYRYESKGVAITKTTDKINSSQPEFEYEILVGDTNREESAQTFPDLLQGDWGYKIVGTKIVIKGGSEEALIKALTAFNSNVIGTSWGAVNKPFYDSSRDTVSRDVRVGRDLVINGTHISQYSIVYPNNGTKFEKELARRMADHIALISGHIIPFYSETQGRGDHEILIGETDRPFSIQTTSGAAIESDQNYIAIVGSTAYDYGLAQEELADLIQAAAIAKQELTLPAKEVVNPSSKISAMAYNVYGFDYYDSRCDNIRRLVTKYLPDILTYQEPDTSMTNKIRMEGYYDWFDGKPRHTKPDGTLVPNASAYGANSISPIFWAKDRFEFILGDTKWTTGTPDEPTLAAGAHHYRMYTYALLRDKQTGEEFIVVNWHMDFDEPVQVPGLQYMFKFFQEAGYTDVPVIMLGDFNAVASSKVISEITVNQGGFTSMHNMTNNPEASSPADIDWIFGMACCVNVSFYKVCRETYPDSEARPDKVYGDGKYPSDHCPVYAEFKIKPDMTEHTHNWSHIGSAVNWITRPSIPTRPD